MRTPKTMVPPLTPFTTSLEVDYDALKAGVDYVVEDCGADIVVAAGVEAQEYHYLSEEERKTLIAKTIDFVNGRRPVAVGISHPSYKTAIGLAEYAASLGAEAVQLLAPKRPFGGEATEDDVQNYFNSVADNISLPIVAYLNAGPGSDLSVKATVQLSKLSSVTAIKESSRDLSRVSRLLVEIDQAGHAEYYTTMQMLLISLQLGGAGVTLPPPAAKLARKIIDAFGRGNVNEATRLQKQFSVYPAKWMPYGLTPVMKASLNHLGVPAGKPYPPFKPLSGADLDALHNYLDTTDL